VRTEDITEYDDAREQPIQPDDVVYILSWKIRAPVVKVDKDTVVVDLGNYEHLLLKKSEVMRVPQIEWRHHEDRRHTDQ
jgi:hypothetical protein